MTILAALVATVLVPADTYLYAGQPVSETGIGLSSWGGGKIVEMKDVSLAGGNALRVQTTNFFQGGLLQFPKPIDLTTAFQDKNNLLAIGVWVADNQASAGGGGGVNPGGGGGRMGGGEGGGRMGGGRMAGGLGAEPPSGGGTTSAPKNMSEMRVVIKTSDGKLSEAILPIGQAGGSVNKWVRTGIPINQIPGFAKTNKQITAIAASGNAPAFFYIGEVRVAVDQTPIQGVLGNSDMNIGRGTDVTLYGSAEAGMTPVEYVWDFDAKDGLQEEARGQAVTHKFRLPGEFKVTLTIKDKYGLKQPWTGTFNVTVNP